MHAWTPEQKEAASQRMRRVRAARRVVKRAQQIGRPVVERVELGDVPRAPAVSGYDAHLAAICQRAALEERLYRLGKMREPRA